MNQQQKSESGKESEKEESSTYFHVFAYRIPKRKHDELLSVQKKLAKIYKKHGTLNSQILQLGKSNIFEGFSGFEKELGTKDGEEIWIEIDTYKNAKEFAKTVTEIGTDADAGPLWGELSQIATEHPIIMGEFEQLTRV